MQVDQEPISPKTVNTEVSQYEDSRNISTQDLVHTAMSSTQKMVYSIMSKASKAIRSGESSSSQINTHQQVLEESPVEIMQEGTDSIESFNQIRETLEKTRQEYEDLLLQVQALDTSMEAFNQMRESLEEAKKVNAVLRAQVLALQERSFEKMRSSSWTPLSDIMVRDVIQGIEKDIEDWARDSAVESFSCCLGHLSTSEEQQLMNTLQHIALLDYPGCDKQFNWWEQQKFQVKHVLAAIATREVFDHASCNPFAIIDYATALSCQDKNFIGKPSGGLQMTLNLLERGMFASFCGFNLTRTVDAKKAHQWRTRLLRQMIQRSTNGATFDGLNPANDEILHQIELEGHKLTREFTTGPSRVFLSPERDASKDEQLANAFTRTKHLFMQLGTHMSSVKCFYNVLTEFDDSAHGALFDEKYHQVHRRQFMTQPEDQGLPVLLALSPVVIMKGNEDGEGYDDCRIVAKALVRIKRETEMF